MITHVTKKAKRKSRTTRPALWHKWLPAIKHFSAFVATLGYVFAILVLFQFVSVQIALGFYQDQVVQGPVRVTAAGTPVKTPDKKGIPVRLKIPSIRVNAVIRSVGLLSDGSMGVPALPRDTAWYKYGPKPGEQGSAVISGHVNWWYGAVGVFQRLNALKPGDKITVEDEMGTSTTFIVRTSRLFGLHDDATDVFRSYDGKAHVNLVTCSGVWDNIARVYSKRLVVFTDKVE